MSISAIVTAPPEISAADYRRAHAGKLMIIRRPEGQPLVASDFFKFDSAGTHPTGLMVTGIFQNDCRSHMMASRVRAANQAEIAWRDSSGENKA
jgi:hypothetical protein